MSNSVLGCLTYLLDVENQLDTDWKNINSEKKLIKTFELKNTEKSQRKIVNKIHQLLHFNSKKLYKNHYTRKLCSISNEIMQSSTLLVGVGVGGMSNENEG